MSWLKNIVRPKIATNKRREMPSNLWQKCPDCSSMLYGKDLVANNNVCENCGYHFPLSAENRLKHLLDEGSWLPIPLPNKKADHLKFKDRKRYSERLRIARRSSGRRDAILIGSGAIGSYPVAIALMDFSFMAGSMGTATGDAIITAAEKAIADKTPLILITASGGARMQEGILSLMQMARTSAVLLKLKEAGLPYIVLLTHPTTGGVTASFAMQGDFSFAEPKALIGFAGPRVIEQTIGAKLPKDFQTAEYLYEHGMIDEVLPRNKQRTRLTSLLATFSAQSPFSVII